MNIRLFNDNCIDVLQSDEFKTLVGGREVVIVTDPPFNVGYHYKTYKDTKPEEEYYKWLVNIFANFPFVIVHYPESIYKLAINIGKAPEKVVSWVYNSNTAKQHRDIAFFDVKPDFNLVRQPYKNPEDKRIKERIARGKLGGAALRLVEYKSS